MKSIILIVPFIYFILAVLTISDYGINWDEPFHFNRGQAYLHYFLTGEKNYLKLPKAPSLKGSSDFMSREGESELYLNSKSSSIPPDLSYRRSYFQSDVFNYEYFKENDGGGHPPANDILAAFFNFIFYQKLGVLGDIEAYHLFEITVATLLILGVTYFTYYHFGILAAFVAGFSLAAYPLFFAESHFNIKDPVETAFFGLTVIIFYFAIIKANWKLVLISAIFAGLALGTKFNALFLPFILITWLIIYFLNNKKVLLKQKILLFSILSYPFISIAIFISLWPYLWQNTVQNLLPVIQFYKESGTLSIDGLINFKYFGFNLFPAFWIATTTPLTILLFSLLGLIFATKNMFKTKQFIFLLLLLWFLVPILRVTIPGAAIHGGVRHIMEFIPAMAILSGIGVYWVYRFLKKQILKFLFIVLLIVMFMFTLLELIKLHPNENIYFNQLVGGLKGAKEKNIPFWGYNYGNVYFQGVEWLNKNAVQNAKLALPIVNMVNVPRIKLRPDIDFSNAYFSGSSKQGEYVMEMSNNWNPRSWYAYAYLDEFLNPVYEVKVDGVTILKIWKNSEQYLREEFKKTEQEYIVKNFNVVDSILNIDLGQKILLTKLKISHSSQDCQTQKGGYIRLSVDGQSWEQRSETIDYPQIPIQWMKWDEKNFTYFFSAKETRFIFLDTQMEDSCLLQNLKIRIYGF